MADTTLSHLTFDDNLQAHVFVSWLHPYKDQRLIVVGESGMVAFNDVAAEADKVLFYPHDVGWRGEVPVLSRADAEPVDYRPDEPLRIECEAFLEAVERGTPPPSDAAEGIRVLKVLQACQDAIISGNKVVF